MSDRVRYSLLGGDRLVVEASGSAAAAVAGWLPLSHRELSEEDAPASGTERRAVVRVSRVALSPQPEVTDPLLRLGSVVAVGTGQGTVTLHGASGSRGQIDLAAVSSHLEIAEGGDHDLYSMMTLSAALLLGRLGFALVHAAAVMDPGGGAWLLVGDTHSGKTTTCVSLVSYGWSYLADDQVVVGSDSRGGITVEGWPRVAHLDTGWINGRPSGRRDAMDIRLRWKSQWTPMAPLSGVFLPRIEPGSQTSVHPAAPALVFAALVRQSPWLMADSGAAPALAGLLSQVALRPGYSLTLGLDSFARGDVLATRLPI